ncbi:MAG TPA: PilZ domain-containing protein [Afifellaceae bacterium]|nr:PilZ domain-containing protein [Afifellaceae bacterium]
MEQRMHGRRRVLKKGLLILNTNGSTFECQVRELGGGGAAVRLYGWTALPERFDLMIPADNLRVSARVAWQRGEEVGLEFMGPSVMARRRQAAEPGRFAAA